MQFAVSYQLRQRSTWSAVRLLLPFLLFSIVSSFTVGFKTSKLRFALQSDNELRQDSTQKFHGSRKALLDTESPISVDEKILKPAALSTLRELLQQPIPTKRNGIVIIAGFEAFNIQLYKKAAALIT